LYQVRQLKPDKCDIKHYFSRHFPPPGHFFVSFRAKFGQFQTFLGVFQAISVENGRNSGEAGRFWTILDNLEKCRAIFGWFWEKIVLELIVSSQSIKIFAKSHTVKQPIVLKVEIWHPTRLKIVPN
jgi:hypothetical protein